jgi:3D (Asp-Asp-Asp) domain-containing protein
VTLDLGSVVVFATFAYGIGCDAPGPYTKLGTVPRERWTIAADQKVLPLGAIVHVSGLGPRRVEDIGPKVKGHTIDLFMDCTAAKAWKNQTRYVTVLQLPGGPRTEGAPSTGATSTQVGDDRGARVEPIRSPVNAPAFETGQVRAATRLSPLSVALRTIVAVLLVLGSVAAIGAILRDALDDLAVLEGRR